MLRVKSAQMDDQKSLFNDYQHAIIERGEAERRLRNLMGMWRKPLLEVINVAREYVNVHKSYKTVLEEYELADEKVENIRTKLRQSQGFPG